MDGLMLDVIAQRQFLEVRKEVGQLVDPVATQ